MKMGALLGPVLDPSQNGFLAEQARRYEGEGFAGLWMAQAIGRGFMLTDPFVALSQAAAPICFPASSAAFSPALVKYGKNGEKTRTRYQ